MVQIMAWCRPGNKPLSEPMMLSLLMHMCILSELKCYSQCWLWNIFISQNCLYSVSYWTHPFIFTCLSHCGWTPFYFMYDTKCSMTFPWCTINAPVAFAWCTLNVPAAFAWCTNHFVHKSVFVHRVERSSPTVFLFTMGYFSRCLGFFNRFLSGSLEHHDCYDTQVPGIPCDLLYKACPWPTCCSCVDFMTHLFSSAQSRGHNCMLRAGYHPFGIHYMMTARHRNAPCITGHLWGESTGQQQISIQK